MRDRLIDVFTHLDEHISYKEEYGILFDTPLVKAVEDVLQMLNGVTVQEWISVKDRLPEKHDKYLVRVPSKLRGCEHCIWLIGYNPNFGFYDADPEWGDIPMDDVTHWMPLPPPPKGE